jgi:hypothetical protein
MLGTPRASRRARLVAWVGVLPVLVCASFLFAVPGAEADFGIKAMGVKAINENRTLDTQAGSHPYEYIVSFTLNQDKEGNPEGTLRDLIIELPPGMVGNPRALALCSGAEFEGFKTHCPNNTVVGVAEFDFGGEHGFSPIYNLAPSLGSLASLGFSLDSLNVFQEASLRTGSDYGVNISNITLPTDIGLQSVTARVWGVPADTGHDFERGLNCLEGAESSCHTELTPKPFITLPTSCTGPLTTRMKIDSLEHPGVFVEEGVFTPGMDGCELPEFEPSIISQPETTQSDSPTGLHFGLHLPQNEDPAQVATADLKDVRVTLPAGLVLNPSAGDGLGACTSVQADLHGAGPADCPSDSKVGTVQVSTPALDHPLPGAVYLAKQEDNPFGSLIALYVAVDDPISGAIVKLAGKVQPDPVTGQLTATFQNNPQLPFEDFDFDFFGGPRAALTTPSTCGTYTTTSDLTPWTAPEGTDAFPTDSFQITTAPGGGGCVSSEGQEPHAPSFQAGTVSPLAGAFSPFVLKLGREDGSQHLAAINTTLPPGLTGKLAGIAQCSDAQIAAAVARSSLGQGALELSAPSCPQSSEVGTITVGAGSGSPFYLGGHAYLAGPYKGAPFSLAIITPAVAGPFDLGVVVVRSGLYIDPDTAQVTVKSDPIPSMLQGIPTDVRSIQVNIDRPEFTLNPTSCEPMSITGQAISTLGQAAPLSDRFQAAGCQNLPFKPSFTASTQGRASKQNGASLTVRVAQKPGEAHIHKVNLALPVTLPSRLTTLQKACTEAQFNQNPAGCPEGAFIGTAKATTPLLATPLTGPAILVSHGGAAFPDVEFLLQAEDVHITLDGKTDIKHGITYSRFETIPDQPITSFETVLPQGPHSILSAVVPANDNYNLCTYTKPTTSKKKVTILVHGQTRRVTRAVKRPAAGQLLIPTTITGQNGAQVTQTTRITITGCPTAKVASNKHAKTGKKHSRHR